MTSQAPQFISAAELQAALRWRYAAKQFDPEQEISRDDLDALLEAVRLAPTSSGMQPFHVTVVSDPAIKTSVRKAAFGQKQVTSSSHVLVFSARPDFSNHAEQLFAAARADGMSPDKIAKLRLKTRVRAAIRRMTASSKSWAARQAYIALGFALLAAAELGIDACPMEGFSPRGVARAIGLERGLSPVVLMAIGRRSPNDTIRPKYRLPKESLIRSI